MGKNRSSCSWLQAEGSPHPPRGSGLSWCHRGRGKPTSSAVQTAQAGPRTCGCPAAHRPPWQPTRWPRASAPVISCRRFFGRSLAPSLLLCLKELGFGGLVTPSEALVSPGDSVLTRHFLLLSLITGGSHVEEQGTRPACVLPPPPRQQSPGSPDSPFSAPRPHGWRGHGLTRPPSCVCVCPVLKSPIPLFLETFSDLGVKTFVI